MEVLFSDASMVPRSTNDASDHSTRVSTAPGTSRTQGVRRGVETWYSVAMLATARIVTTGQYNQARNSTSSGSRFDTQVGPITTRGMTITPTISDRKYSVSESARVCTIPRTPD